MKINSNDDFDLVKRFINGDESAFNRIIINYQKKIYWHARRMTNNHLDADDIVQEVLLVLYKKLKTFEFKSSLYTWIYKITATRSLNYIKKRNLRKFFSTDEKEAQIIKDDKNIIENFEAKEKLNKINELLMKIPPKQREVFILRNYENLSYEEISKITGRSVGGLKSNYFHAMKKILEMMNENED